MRLYKSVRLASVTSVWSDDLIVWKQKQLDKEIEDGLLEKSEHYLLEEFPFLDGISRNISFKVSFSSVVEWCYRVTENYSSEEWNDLSNEMENFKIITDNEVSSNTPKLYLEDYIWTGLESYQRKLMEEDNKRILRLSYVIRLVVFAGWTKFNKDFKEGT